MTIRRSNDLRAPRAVSAQKASASKTVGTPLAIAMSPQQAAAPVSPTIITWRRSKRSAIAPTGLRTTAPIAPKQHEASSLMPLRGNLPALLADRRGLGMQFVVIARDGTDPEAPARRQAVRPAHLEGIRPFVEQGNILVGGAILDEVGDMVGWVVMADFPTREELDAWLTGDPYVTDGVWQEVEVQPYRAAVGAWLPTG